MFVNREIIRSGEEYTQYLGQQIELSNVSRAIKAP